MKLYAVRHGQTPWNAMKKMQGSADIELSEKGIEQAHATEALLADVPIDRIFASPYLRARKTAEIVRGARKIEIVFDDRLKERDYGEFEGTPKSSFDYNAFWAYHRNLRYEKAENVQDFFARVYDFLDEIKAQYPEDSVLIVAHAGVIKAIRCYAGGMLADDEIGPFLPDNASVLEYVL